MVWYKNYNWKSNPFVIDPIPDTFIIDDIRKKVEEAIYSGDILNLYGQTGTGKTSLLRAMEASMKGAFVPVYIDPLDLPNYAPDGISDDKRQYEGFLAKLKKDALKDPLAGFKRLLGQRRTLLESLKSTYKGKKLVLLIDEAKDISDPTIPSYFRSIKNSGADCSIIITSIDPVSKLQTFADSLRDVRVSFLQMRTVSLEEAKEMMFPKEIAPDGISKKAKVKESKIKVVHVFNGKEMPAINIIIDKKRVFNLMDDKKVIIQEMLYDSAKRDFIGYFNLGWRFAKG
ncbi:hypothetical protein KKF81_05370 [Candidatus Micrarchaeota archaeon]|nr:hypothetical protein [Candidatus Micrarchaeota archaeon]